MTASIAIASREHVISPAESAPWAWLYRTGGAAALLTAAFLPIQIAAFLMYPPPDSVPGWFTLFQAHPLAGLIDLDILLVADQVLAMLMFLALYIVLRRASQSLMLIALVLGLASTVFFIASNPAFAMLTLSNAYGSAAGAERSMMLAAAQTALAQWEGSAFQVSYLIGSIATILMSVGMLRNGAFSKGTAYVGILANTVALGYYVPVVGVYISVFSVLFLWAWYLLVGIRLFRLARSPWADQA